MRTATIFSLMAAVLVLSTIVMYWAGANVLYAQQQVVRLQSVVTSLQRFLSTIKDAETGQRGYILTGEPQYLKPYDEAVASVESQTGQLEILTTEGEIPKNDLKTLTDQKLAELRLTIGLRRSGGIAAAIGIIDSGKGKAIMDKIRAVNGKLIDGAVVRLTASEHEITAATTVRNVTYGVLLVCNLSFLAWAHQRIRIETDRRIAVGLQLAIQREEHAVTLASIGDAVIATDPNAVVTYMNPTAEQLTGWTLEDALGKSLDVVFNIVNEETRNTVESPVARALREGAAVGLANHTVLIAKDGIEKPIDDSAAPIFRSGEIVGVVLVFHDVTERRAAEKKIAASEVRYRRLFEAAHDGVLIVDAVELRVIAINPFLADMLHRKPEECLGESLWEIGLFSDKAACDDAMQSLAHSDVLRYTIPGADGPDGLRIPVEVIANAYQEEDRSVVQLNVRDMSEKAQFDRQREAMLASEQALRAEADAANRSKDMFLATLSHELRTPLSAILGWISILRQPRHTEEDLREAIDVIERNSKAQLKLIEDVMDVSRITSGKMRLELLPCSLAEIVRASLGVTAVTARDKGITLHSQLEADLSPIVCDGTRMQQVVWNLLTNAIKFTPRGGNVTVELAREDPWAVIRVRDTGQGISEDLLPHVFDHFRQADNSTRRRYSGLGLGLSIVQQIVEMHGGQVTAESEGDGKGATLTVKLPLAGKTPDDVRDDSRSWPVPEALGLQFHGLHVLVVEDEPDSRRWVEKLLSSHGARVTVAAGAAEALLILESGRPDILVSDLGMPNMDGFDLIENIRGKGISAHEMPAIALSAYAQERDERRALSLGYQLHIGKPVDSEDLLTAVAGLAKPLGES